MRIGLYARVPRRNGGNFQYTLTLLEMARTLGSDDEFVVLRGRRTDLPPHLLTGEGWSSAVLPRRWMEVVQDIGVALVGDERARRVWYSAGRLNPGSVVSNPDQAPQFDPAAERWYRNRDIGLVIYPVRSHLAFDTRVPAIVTVHDLNHRRYPSSEAAALGEFERREFYFRNVCRHAATVLVDSEASRDDLLTFYADTGLTADRVVVLPMLAQPAVRRPVTDEDRQRIRDRYGLTGDFLFYPAQFWPHKNHARLIDALHRLKQESGLTPLLLLGGAYAGALRRRTFMAAMQKAQALGIAGQVRYTGFIPEDDLAPIYSAAAGLVIPTLFEGANLPVLEAFTAGCPVVTSDIRGIREQAGGAAILVDPQRADAIADGIRRLLTSPAERGALVSRGREVVARYTPEQYRQRLRQAIDDTHARASRAGARP